MAGKRKVRLSLSVEKTSNRRITITRIKFVSKPKDVIKYIRASTERRVLTAIDWGNYPPGVKKKILVHSVKEFRAIKESVLKYNNRINKNGNSNDTQRQNNV